MIRYAEVVLNGHPDRFCDLVADRIIEEAYRFDSQAYGQVEVAVWSDRIWLSGATVTRTPFTTPVRDLVREVGRFAGYTNGNWVDVDQYELDDHLCRIDGDPRQWTGHVNDQAIVIGYAGYDEKTRYLPPEQFLAQALRESVISSLEDGLLKGEGPDGKLLVRIREEGADWRLEHLLITIQQQEESRLPDVVERTVAELAAAYNRIRQADARWSSRWREVEILVNPNGPLLNGGSDGDNGQTGRKLAIDYYGPRVPIGGGALSGKDLTHIDRAGAYAARQEALDIVARGARECTVTVAYAPGCDEPLDARFDILGSVRPPDRSVFNHKQVCSRWADFKNTGPLGAGIHFFDSNLPWNRRPGEDTIQITGRHPLPNDAKNSVL